MPARMLSLYENEHPSLTPHWKQVTSKRYDNLPAVDVAVGSWVCVVDCELPNQNHIQLFCFWVAAWLFECTVEATRLIMKISFSEISLSSIKPVLSALYRIFLFIIEWGFKKRSQAPLLSFQPPNISQDCRTQNSRLEHWFNASQSSTPTPSSHDRRKTEAANQLRWAESCSSPDGICHSDMIWRSSVQNGLQWLHLQKVFEDVCIFSVCSQLVCDSWHFKAPPTLVKHKLNFIDGQEFWRQCKFKMLSLDEIFSSIYLVLSYIELIKAKNHWTLFKLEKG